MTEQPKGRRAIETAATGQMVARNLGRLRKVRQLTTRQLAAELERHGRPIPASGITRMEKGERQVTVDDLMALAVVLGVSPLALLLPVEAEMRDEVELTGAGKVTAADAWAWGCASHPLKPGTTGRALYQARMEFRLYGVPHWLTAARDEAADADAAEPGYTDEEMRTVMDILRRRRGTDGPGVD